MSAEKQRTETQSGFAAEGYADNCPNFHLDSIRFEAAFEMSDMQLAAEDKRYNTFLDRSDVYAPQREKANHNLARLAFERECRDGKYDYVIDAKYADVEVDDFDVEELLAKH